ncbi:hypothetical protein WA577_005382 [Blastocystis sp. JDR]
MPMTQMSLSDSSEPDFPVNEDCLGTSNAVGNCLICPLLALDPEAPKLPKRRERDSLMSFEDMDSVASSDVSKTTDRTACDLSCFLLYSDCYYSYLVDDNEWKTAEDNFVIRHVKHISEYYQHLHVFRCASHHLMYHAFNCEGKRVVLKSFSAVNGVSEDFRVSNECIIHSSLHHDNILPVVDCFWCKNAIYLVTEEMKTSVVSIISKSSFLPEPIIKYIIRSCVAALAYIHSHGCLHGDIKCENMLVSDGVVKLAGFGSASCLTQLIPWRDSWSGTLNWMAPEVVRGELYGFAADIWSVGIVLLELVNGDAPYVSMSPQNAFFVIAEEEEHYPVLEPERWSSDLLDFCDACLQIKPCDRMTANELLHHPFLVSGVASSEEFSDYVALV